MKWDSKRFSGALVLLVSTALGPVTSPAQAQSATSTGTGTATGMGYGMGMGMGMGYGMGLGMGMGMGSFRYAPSPTDYLNQRASLNAARRSAPGPQGSMAANPNAYYNKVRDDGFVSHADSQVRRAASATPALLIGSRGPSPGSGRQCIGSIEIQASHPANRLLRRLQQARLAR